MKYSSIVAMGDIYLRIGLLQREELLIYFFQYGLSIKCESHIMFAQGEVECSNS